MTARFGLMVAAGCLALASAACSPGGEPKAEAAKSQAVAPIQVEVYRIEQREQDGVLRASGLVAYKSETLLSFGAPGMIETLLVDDGARVRVGQVLATLRRTTVGADPAESEVVRQTAQQTFDRVSRLHAAGAASQADLDNARLGLERAREIVSIVAPASGVILRRDVERGQMVTTGQVVLQLGEDRTGIIVRAQLSSVDVSQVKVGDTATIAIPGRDARTGKVSQISPKMAANMGSFEVEVRLDDPKDLKSGEVAEVRIAAKPTTGPSRASYLIPAISLIDARADQGMVYVVDQTGKATRRSIQTEGVTDAGVVVTGGLQPGEAIITRGASMVRDGDTVTFRQE
ncbi:MAG: efflux RND transporter periplasmic adaptor subunit [Alphaproteobacteria bacterium]|nr:MAG: efflux RND transporter periplasmic adaptor subunit [Alphaproteobacteria bacterium]